jgi:septal ring factor EnvC (AmiA/AmiB activator)
MAEVTLEMLQVMVQKVLEGQKRHDQDFIDVKIRLSSIERGIAGLKRDDADTVETTAHLQAQVDRLREEIDKINRRLELGDA